MKLESNLNREELLFLLQKQLNSFFLLSKEELELLPKAFDFVWNRVYNCFRIVNNKYFTKDGLPYFNTYHSGQYLIFLYYYSNTCSTLYDGKELADKLYYLNKILHSCDIYHEVSLPESFFLEHPIGTVLGRASYGNNFFAMQGCTVGGNKNIYPTIGNNVKLYSGAKVIGACTVGDNVVLAANSYVKDTNIPDNATVFGQYPNLIIKFL